MMNRAVMIGERYKPLLADALAGENITALWLPDNPNVDPRVAGHADLSAFAFPDKRVLFAGFLKGLIKEKSNDELNNTVNYLTNNHFDIIFTEFEQNCVYPNDCALCACPLGEYALHNEKITSGEIKSFYGDKLLDVNQGYSRCTALAVSDDAVITADPGIARALLSRDFRVLQIASGQILLEGYDTGFIGGAGFALGQTVYFTGDIRSHSSHEEIKSFIESCGKSIHCLTQAPLIDIGGAIKL